MATIYEVAEKAGVSIATVSRVLNGKDRITEKTRRKVLAVVDELEYTPSMGAQMLSGGAARNILAVLPLHPVISPACVNGIDQVAKDNGYNILIGYSELNGTSRLPLDEMISSNLISGIIYQTYLGNESIQTGVPMVMIGENPALDYPHCVISNDCRGTCALTTSLIRMGRKRFAYVSSTPAASLSYSFFVQERLKGMKEALASAGLTYDPALTAIYVVDDKRNYEEMYEKVSGFAGYIAALPADQRPDAVICAYDYIAMVMINELQKYGLQVPEDIAVTGFDNDNVCRMTSPAIATAATSYEDIGREAARMLLTLIAGQEPEAPRIMIDPKIILRASAGIVPTET